MSSGIPLDDVDRAGWLEALGHELASRKSIVLACSALKKIYRDRLRELASPIRFFVLTAERGLLEERLAHREHFMPGSLLDSQLNTLELGEDVVVLANDASPEQVAETLVAAIHDVE